MNTIKVKTTQNVAVEYELASIGDRVVAHLIDVAVFIAWIFILFIIAELFGITGDTNVGIVFIVGMLPIVFYHLASEIFMNGQSVGKRAKDIKVVKLDGTAPSIGDYALRWVFRIIDTLLFNGLVATIAVAANNNNQRLGDLAAGTTVIRTRPVQRQQYLRVKLQDDYVITFPEVTLISDKDMALIRKLLYKAREYQNVALLEKIAERTKAITGITTTLDDEDFLITIIKDHQHAHRMAEA